MTSRKLSKNRRTRIRFKSMFYVSLMTLIATLLYMNQMISSATADEKLESTSYHSGPACNSDVINFEDAKKCFNFGAVSIESNGDLATGIYNTKGDAVYDLVLQPK